MEGHGPRFHVAGIAVVRVPRQAERLTDGHRDGCKGFTGLCPTVAALHHAAIRGRHIVRWLWQSSTR